ncbi:TonB-dependent receptor [Phenylobacterium sp.]|uniref:TonB-dependent receptor n=1 Tax=Phenylobacterium sp. TaxID=1871053 RepID=UPI0025D252D0|nr:TonB-dependent receptor [Phenylobacterium sp.]MBX3481995.1 TonB-dependent receptor [Phenylobacterium sp.]MCW5758828.1 TonB-dependent receptor [Phenylobacterium sp.]
MTTRKIALQCGSAIGVLVAGFAAAPVSAQVAGGAPAAASIEEVIVTARRREENLQDVPAAVTAVSGEALESRQIRNASDLQIVIPSLSVGGANSVFSRNSANYSIRGIGQGLFGGGSVTSYFAEAPFGPTGPSMPFFDIASVQVLKGPQGTLFGRATAGGAVLIGPNPPSADDFYGSINGKFGNLQRSDVNVVLNVPIIDDQLAFRLALNRTHRQGYVKNTITGQHMDGDDSRSIRASLLFKPADWFKNTLFYNYYDFDSTTAARVTIGANLGLANLNRNAAAFAAVCGQAVQFGFATDVAGCQAQRVQILADIRAALVDEVNNSRQGGDNLRRMTTGTAYPNREYINRHDLVNTTEITLPSVGVFEFGLKNIFSFQQARNLVAGNYSATPFDLNASAFGTSSQSQWINGRLVGDTGKFNKTFTNEIQFNGSVYDDALIWIAGYYYQNQPVSEGLRGSTNLNRTFGGVGTPNLGPISATPMALAGHNRETAYFGQFTADLGRVGLNGLKFTAGYRKTHTEVTNVSAAAVVSYPSGLVTPGAVSRSVTKGSGPGYTFALDWKVTEDLLVYATRRRGYKPGGLNTIQGASAVPGFVPQYEPESVIDTELGAKLDFLLGDVRGRLNVAAYKDDYTNIQRGVNAITPAGQNIAFTANVAAASIKGFEAEGFLTFDRWSLIGTYSYTDAAYTRWTGSDPLGAAPAGTNIDLSNNPFANTPKHKASLTVQYDVPVDEQYGRVKSSLTASWQSRSWLSDNAQRYIEVYSNNPTVILAENSLKNTVSEPGFLVMNARVDWVGVFGREDIDASLFVKNLTDKTYAFAGALALQSLGVAQKLYAEPRTYGVELTYRFGAR